MQDLVQEETKTLGGVTCRDLWVHGPGHGPVPHTWCGPCNRFLQQEEACGKAVKHSSTLALKSLEFGVLAVQQVPLTTAPANSHRLWLSLCPFCLLMSPYMDPTAAG